jgi:nucleoside-diphosphate-sugar epimerase
VRPVTLVVGVGYLGGRFCNACENDVVRLTRPAFDLDAGDPLSLELPAHYSILYTVPPPGDSPSDVRLERLLAELRPAPQRFVYISTTGVYGDHRGASVDEETAINPGSEHAARRVAAENSLRDWQANCDTRLVILRVPGIYGHGRLGIERIREGTAIVRDDDAGPGNRIHVDDLVACCFAALRDDTPGGTYNVGDGDHRSSTWFAKEVARQAGLAAPPEISMAEAERQFSPMRLSFLRDQRRVDTRKMREILKVSPRYSNAEDGIAASLHS